MVLLLSAAACFAATPESRTQKSPGIGEADGIAYSGSGSPEKIVAAVPGSHYADTLTGAVWTKYLGTGTTGWFTSRTDYLANWWKPDTSLYVSVGGYPEEKWRGREHMDGGYTCIDPYIKSRCRQDGRLRKLRWRTFNTGQAGHAFKIKVFRPSGEAYAFVGEDTGIYPNNNEVQTCNLKNPIPWKTGDTVGIYGAEHSRPYISAAHGRFIACATGDVSESNPFSSTRMHRALDIEPYDHPPSAVMTGDSVTSNGYSGYFISDGPSNDEKKIPLQPMHHLQRMIDPDRFTYQNLGRGGTPYEWTLSTGVPKALASMTRNLIIASGNNDIGKSDWSAIEKALYGIKALCEANAVVPELYICSLAPTSHYSDEQAAQARRWNAHIKSWCAANHATFIDIYSTLGKKRKSTGFHDNLADAYDKGDRRHCNPAGAAAFATIIKNTIESKDYPVPLQADRQSAKSMSAQ